MVGVPGRSKGCNTCIQRKVKCDGGQPMCGNCRKSNRLCTGYKRPVAFVMSSDVTFTEPMAPDEPEGMSVTTQGRWRRRVRKLPEALPEDGPSVKEKKEKKEKAGKTTTKTIKTIKTDSSDTPAPLSVDLETTVTQAQLKRYKKAFGSVMAPEDAEAMSALRLGRMQMVETMTQTMSMSSTAFALPLPSAVSTDAAWREQLFPVFLDLHLPAELLQGCTRGRGQRPRNWLMNLPHAALDGSPALETAMAALCMARVGRQAGPTAGASLVRHSLTLYTRGLRQLQRAIDDPRLQRQDQTLAACLTLSMYELAECPTRRSSGYVAHQDGGLALLQMRGPGAHVSPLAHSLFVFLRVQNFIYAIMNRKSNFLSQPEWLQQPWQGTAKVPHDHFMDQMYGIPVLMEQTDLLAASGAAPDELAAGYRALIVRYVALDTCLKRWQRDLKAIVSGPLYWPELSAVHCPIFDDADNSNGTSARGRPYPVAFHFPAFFIGQAVILYWLIVLFVNVQMADLYRRIDALEGAAATVPASPSADWTPPPTFSTAPSSSSSSSSSSPPPPLPSSSPSSSPPPPSSSPPASTPASASSPSSTPPPVISLLAAAAAADETIRTMTSNICQSIEYFLQDNMGDIGSLSTLLPLTAVRYHLLRTPSSRPCQPGPPGRPGEHSDEVLWVDFLIQLVGGKGQLMALYIEAD